MRWVRVRSLDLAWAVVLASVLTQAYALLHDLGQALAARSMGVQVLAIQPWLFARAPVRLVGDLDGPAGAWVALGGTLVPWLVVCTALAFARPRRSTLRLAALVAASWILAALVPWILIPLLGRWPAGHDALQFLARSGVAPWAVAGLAGLAAALLVAAGWRATGGPERLRGAWGGAAGEIGRAHV